jgi:prepilin-type N-terminal cleavage/methylation domain-containing protein
MGGREAALVGKGLTSRAGVATAMAPGGAGKNQRGLSITELMISIAIAGIVMGGLYNLFISQQKVLGIQDQGAEMHQAARAAMDFMVREFRMLGYGVPNASWDGCAAPCPPTKITPTPTATSITFRGNQDATRTTLTNDHACVTYVGGSNIQCASGLTPLAVDSTSEFKLGDTIYVEGQTFTTSPYSTHWHTATVTAKTATSPPTLTISTGLNFEYVRGSTVHVVKTVTYAFDTSEKQISRDGQPLAENINALTLSYVFEDTGTGLPNDGDSDTTNNTSNIRTISISVTARTPKPDPAYKQNSGYRLVTVTSQVTPRNLP